ncbi:polyprenyl synthetase family protein [Daejeonella oryzae]|uniref:polyprenyl synthetase family protein n=1 Tax=Daejeonella oryzae TaxID=1122943 RepID=UPI00042A7421|nr:polyprenyl synthetase family protein [Daejeonella oryzae]
MQSIEELQKIIDRAISESQYPESPQELYQPITYLMELGGKRLRPASLLMACNLFSDNISKAIKPALGIEVFHNFTLMHDDIMDNAPLRRGKPTVHKKWNQSVAILSGDVMLVEAYKLMMQVETEIIAQILGIFNDTAVGVCEGQQMDMNFESVSEVNVEQYINMIRLKTAVLLGGALKIGALIGGSSLTDAELLYQFGENLGIAFQLHDDILDVYGDPEKFGKQVGGDILSNKKTFMLISARALATGELNNSLEKWLEHTEKDPGNKVQAVTEIYDQLGVKNLAEKEMMNFAEKAIRALEQVSAETSKKEILRKFAETLLVRES